MSDKKNIITSIIVAMAQNGCIGKDNSMPWHISEDLKRFKTLTMDHPVIMGRKTFESIMGYLGTPLPGRDNIVISRSNFTAPENTTMTPSIEEAIRIGQKIANKRNKSEIFIIGGAQIYELALPTTDRLYLTKIHKTIEGDAFFPHLKETEWQETAHEDYMENNPPYSFITLSRQ